MKKTIEIITIILLIFSFASCDINYEPIQEKGTIEEINLDHLSDSPLPTIDCPSFFIMKATIHTTGAITIDDISVTITDPNVVSVKAEEFELSNNMAYLTLKIMVIGENSCEIFVQSKDGSVKSETFYLCGMSFDGIAEYVLNDSRKIVHKRDCEKVGYIAIDDRKYINETDFHYDYRKCEDCMSK